MSDRKPLIADFISVNDLGGYAKYPLPRDASSRRYTRLVGGDEELMLMDAPPPKEDVRAFIKVAAHLEKLGLSAPHVWAADEENGILLLEDFGDNTFTKMLNYGTSEQQLYEDAIDVLITLHNNPANCDIDLAPYDLETYQAEASLLTQWYLPEIDGAKWTEAGNQAYLKAWADIFKTLPTQAPTLVLRDFHVDNLMILASRTNPKNCGLLDFQDALIGAPAYDVMSLLEDARRDISDKLRGKLLKRYLDGVSCPDREGFMLWYTFLAAQRHAKVAGIFIRLFRRDRKDIYLKHIPRVVGLLARHLDNPTLSPLKAWFDEYLPNFKQVPDLSK